jgi:outer membrane protein assembly factor BamA
LPRTILDLLVLRGVALLLLLACSASPLFSQLVRIDSVSFSGLKKTRPQLLRRVMTLQEGDSIASADLADAMQKDQQNIYNLSLFTVVKVVADTADTGLVVRVTVQERWYVWPQPFVALEERTFNEWWADKDLDRLVYGLGLTWQNVSGWNDNLYVYAQNGYSQRVTAQFYRPFLFPKPQIDGTFSFYYVNNKEIGYGTSDGFLQLARLRTQRMRESYTVQATFGKRFTARDQLQFTAGYQYFSLNDSIRYFNDRYLTDGATVEQYPFVNISYQNDQRDMRSFPLSGYKYSAFFRQLGLPGVGTSVFSKVGLSFSQHLALSKRWNFAYGTQSYFLLGRKVPFYDKFFIGFGSFLRGFEPYVIDGSFVTLNKAEWKFGLIPRQFVHLKWLPLRRFRDFPLGLYISAFVDAGYVHDRTFNNLDPSLKNRALVGYGVGLNLFSLYDSLWRLEYSRTNLGNAGIYISTLVSIQ